MTKILFTLLCAIMLSGCVVYSHPAYVVEDDCFVFDDAEYGEREICNTDHYYDADGNVFYWDAQFGIWVSSRGYYQGGVWYVGYHPGWRAYYHQGWYRPRGYYYHSSPHYRYYGHPHYYRGRR